MKWAISTKCEQYKYVEAGLGGISTVCRQYRFLKRIGKLGEWEEGMMLGPAVDEGDKEEKSEWEDDMWWKI